MAGRYIAFEGIEGAGKSTVAGEVAARLEAAGERVVAVREPGGTPAGELIRRVLLDPELAIEPWTEAMLFAAGRAQLAAEVVRPALQDGAVVISDRSVYSSLAYQGGGRGLGIDAVRRVNAAGLAGTWPHHVVLLRIDPSTGLGRQEIADRIGAEGVDFQLAVAAAFDALAAAEPEVFTVLDASDPLDRVVGAALAAIMRP